MLVPQLGPRRGHRVFIANVLKCRLRRQPQPGRPAEVEQCEPFLKAKARSRQVRPGVIVGLGRFAARSRWLAHHHADRQAARHRAQLRRGFRGGHLPSLPTCCAP
ncbi:uracil-DNA glycosylase family protein [Cupriavidus basilensis]